MKRAGTVTVYRGEEGGLQTEILSTSTVGNTTTSRLYFVFAPNALYGVDNVRFLSDDHDRTTTMTFNSANELLTSADYNGTITYTYDASGRTTKKTRGSNTADYAWGFGNFLTQVDSDFPDEGLVDYEYGGNFQRRSRDDGTNYTWFNWAGGTPINEEAQGAGTGDGALTNTYIGKLAEIEGSNPATGDESYYMMDHLGSVRGIVDGSDATTGLTEFSPFGNPITAQLPSGFDPRYTVHHLDSASGMYYTQFRYLNPETGRWLKRDPRRMVDGPNMYDYVGNRPLAYIDFDGLWFHIAAGAILGGVLGAITAAPGNRLVGAFSGASIGALAAATGGYSLVAGGLVGATGAVAGTALANPNADISDFAEDLAFHAATQGVGPIFGGGKAIKNIDDLGDEIFALFDDIIFGIGQICRPGSDEEE